MDEDANAAVPGTEVEDLYGDLAAASERATVADLEARLAASEEERETLAKALANANAANEALQKDNDTLANNISVLFNTAKAEVDRRTREVERLEAELDKVEAAARGQR